MRRWTVWGGYAPSIVIMPDLCPTHLGHMPHSAPSSPLDTYQPTSQQVSLLFSCPLFCSFFSSIFFYQVLGRQLQLWCLHDCISDILSIRQPRSTPFHLPVLPQCSRDLQGVPRIYRLLISLFWLGITPLLEYNPLPKQVARSSLIILEHCFSLQRSEHIRLLPNSLFCLSPTSVPLEAC